VVHLNPLIVYFQGVYPATTSQIVCKIGIIGRFGRKCAKLSQLRRPKFCLRTTPSSVAGTPSRCIKVPKWIWPFSRCALLLWELYLYI